MSPRDSSAEDSGDEDVKVDGLGRLEYYKRDPFQKFRWKSSSVSWADDKPTILYRLFDEGGSLLYVGISSRVTVRLGQHFANKRWFPDVGKMTWETYPARYLAEWAEKEAIRNERPLYNKHYSERF